MSRISPVFEPEAGSELSHLYQQIVANGFGAGERPLNWFSALGCRPDLVRASWELVRGVIVEGCLPPTLKQMVLAVISKQNDCRYCSVTHINALESLGVSKEMIEACARDPEFCSIPEPQRSVLLFAVKAAGAPTEVTDEEVSRLRDFGMDDAEITELFLVIATALFANTWADLSGIPLDR